MWETRQLTNTQRTKDSCKRPHIDRLFQSFLNATLHIYDLYFIFFYNFVWYWINVILSVKIQRLPCFEGTVVILILKAPQNHRSINPKNDPKSKTWEVKVQFSKMFERMIYAVACMLYQEWRLQRDASSMFKCGEFPNAPSWEFLAYIVTAGAQTLPSVQMWWC